MMDIPNTRRKLSTYGKGNRKILVHDLFDSKTFPSQPRQQSLNSPSHDENKSTGGYPKTSTDGFHVKSDSEKSRLKLRSTVRPASPLSKNLSSSGTNPDETTNAHLFELQSSEDEKLEHVHNSMRTKRRKMTPQPTRSKAQIDSDSITGQNYNSAESDQEQNPTDVKRSTHMPSKSRISGKHESETAVASYSTDEAKSSNYKTKTRKVVQQSTDKSAPRTKRVPKNLMQTASRQRSLSRTGSESPEHLSDHSIHSTVSKPSTPKRKRHVLEDHPSDGSSPSHIELALLRLTPERNAVARNEMKFDDQMKESHSPRKGRRRLIDMLDAPQQEVLPNEASFSDSAGETETKSSNVNRLPEVIVNDAKTLSNIKESSVPQLQKSSSSQSVSGTGKTRATYGKQRSHLSEMVDGLAEAEDPASQRLLSHMDPYPSLALQMELDDDEESDNQAATSQLKSIHELRKAGANNRFDRDLDVLLDDLASNTKALNLQALVQLIKKLENSSFKQHVLDCGKLPRLMALTAEKSDLPSAFLMTVALSMLSSAELPSMTSLIQIYDTLQLLTPHLIQDKRAFSKTVKDRKQNLSKAMIRDLVDFEMYLREQDILQTSQKDDLLVSRVVTESLANTLRKLIELNYPIPRVSHRLLDNALAALDTDVTNIHDSSDIVSSSESIKSLMSWFEMSSARSEDWTTMLTPARGKKLGQALARVMTWARSGHTSLEQSALRLVVSLSNNQQEICKAFRSTDIIGAVFSVIDEHFLPLADSASKDQEIDRSKLDSVILALGCLLNFADCDEEARKQMSLVQVYGESQIDRLVKIFNQHIDATTEAVTFDQTQVLVAFGYMSMLLCTLCLDVGIREEISQKIKGAALERLFDAAETFLSHMQAIEGGGPSRDDSASTFSARFNSILDIVEQSAA